MKKILLTLLALTVTAGSVLAQKRQTQVAIDDGSGKYGLIKTGTLTGNHTYTLPDADGTLLLTVVGGYLPLSGGTMTGALNMGAFSITGALIGNASTATKLFTARNINGVAFDGSTDITVPAAAGTLTGATLASNVLSSSLTSVGTLANLTVTNPISGSVTGTAGSLSPGAAINGVTFSGAGPITVTAAAGTLTGATLASNVLSSSLTSVGTLTNLTVTNPISGSVTGNAGTATKLSPGANINGVAFDGSANITVPAAAGTLTGGTLASGVTASSLTSVGTLATLTVTAPISGSVTGSAASFTGSLAGDVSGTQSATSVDKIKGNTVPTNATGYLRNNGTGTLTWATTSGSSIFVGQTTSNQDGGPDYYAPMGSTAGNNTTPSFVASDIRMPRAGTCQHFYVDLQSGPGAGSTRTFAITNVTTPGSISVTISGTATSGSNTSSTLAVNAGDVLRIVATQTGGATNKQAAWTFEFQ